MNLPLNSADWKMHEFYSKNSKMGQENNDLSPHSWMNLWWCPLLYFIGYSLWTLHFPWIWTLYLSIFYYQCKPNYHSIFMLKVIDRFCYLLVKMLMFTVFSYHTNPETDDCSGLLIKVYYSALMLLLSNSINASSAARGPFLTCYNTMRPISL